MIYMIFYKSFLSLIMSIMLIMSEWLLRLKKQILDRIYRIYMIFYKSFLSLIMSIMLIMSKMLLRLKKQILDKIYMIYMIFLKKKFFLSCSSC